MLTRARPGYSIWIEPDDAAGPGETGAHSSTSASELEAATKAGNSDDGDSSASVNCRLRYSCRHLNTWLAFTPDACTARATLALAAMLRCTRSIRFGFTPSARFMAASSARSQWKIQRGRLHATASLRYCNSAINKTTAFLHFLQLRLPLPAEKPDLLPSPIVGARPASGLKSRPNSISSYLILRAFVNPASARRYGSSAEKQGRARSALLRCPVYVPLIFDRFHAPYSKGFDVKKTGW